MLYSAKGAGGLDSAPGRTPGNRDDRFNLGLSCVTTSQIEQQEARGCVMYGQEVLRSKGQLEAQSPAGILHKTVFAKVGTRNPGQPCQMLLEKDNESFKRHNMRRRQEPASKKTFQKLFLSLFSGCKGYQPAIKDIWYRRAANRT